MRTSLIKIGAKNKDESFNFTFFSKWNKLNGVEKVNVLGRMIRSCRNMRDVNICADYARHLSDFERSCLVAWCCGEFAGLQGREIL